MATAKSKRPRKSPRKIADIEIRNPVAIAMAKRDIKVFASDVSMRAYLIADNSDATGLLSRLAEFIGMAAEGERLANGFTPRMKVLHGALRNVQGMCLAGYRWNSAFAGSMDKAMQLAIEVVHEKPDHSAAAIPSARHFSNLILNHKVTQGVIAGAEIYQDSNMELAA